MSRLALPLFAFAALFTYGGSPLAAESVSAEPMSAEPILVARQVAGVDFVHVGGELDAKRFIVEENGSGVALFDYDGDGDLDVYFVNGSRFEQPVEEGRCCNVLYRNDGDWRFVDVTTQAGVGDAGWGQGVAVGDFDGDGHPDLYLANFGADVLYRNRGDGTFEDVTQAAGLGDAGWGAAAAFADFDGDGDLDLYVSRYLELDLATLPAEPCTYKGVRVACGPIGFSPQPDLLYENRNGSFVEVSGTAGLGDLAAEYGLGVWVGDLDFDGLPEVLVANDSGANFLLHNLGGDAIRFEDVAWTSGVATSGDGRFQAGMGVDASDVNGDGRLDLFLTHFMDDHNTLYLASGELLFRDASYPSGLGGPSRLRMAWGTRFFDADHDGHLDLYVGNGHLYPEVSALPSEAYGQDDQLFLGAGAGRFTDASVRLEGTRDTVSRGVATGDLDGDGDLDIVVTQLDRPPLFLDNLTGGEAWLRLDIGRLAETGSASVRLRHVGNATRLRLAGTSGSYASTSEPVVHFGLGDVAGNLAVDVLEGRSGRRWRGLERGVSYRIAEPTQNRGRLSHEKGELSHDQLPHPFPRASISLRMDSVDLTWARHRVCEQCAYRLSGLSCRRQRGPHLGHAPGHGERRGFDFVRHRRRLSGRHEFGGDADRVRRFAGGVLRSLGGRLRS